MSSTKKIRLGDITPSQLEQARRIYRYIIAMQTAPINGRIGSAVVAEILRLTPKGRSPDAGLYAGLSNGLNAGLRNGLNAGLHNGLNAGLSNGLNDGLYDGLDDGLNAGLYDGLDDGLNAGLYAGLGDGLNAGLYDGLDDGLSNGLRAGPPEYGYCGVWWAWWLARYMIAASFGCPLDQKKLAILWGWCRHCGCVMQNVVTKQLVFVRPTSIKWASTKITPAPFSFPVMELHADGEPAVEVGPHLKLYYHHNVRFPERYGSVKVANWDPMWILTEKNAEIRRWLIRGVGYDKFLCTVNANKKDTWREYELLHVELPDMPVAYRLLKMTCPSTGHVHTLRVPPDVESCRDAVTWVNWGIEKESFSVEH